MVQLRPLLDNILWFINLLPRRTTTIDVEVDQAIGLRELRISTAQDLHRQMLGERALRAECPPMDGFGFAGRKDSWLG